MKRTWIKFIYERDTYVIALECIGTFTRAENGRLMFYLPNGKVLVILHRESNLEVYQQVLDYVEKTTGQSLVPGSRVKVMGCSEESFVESEACGQLLSEETKTPRTGT